jgi:hypothetical protein
MDVMSCGEVALHVIWGAYGLVFGALLATAIEWLWKKLIYP